MSARVSLAPGSRKGTSTLSSSLSMSSSSQIAGPSSLQSAFSFRPHVLLPQGANNGQAADSRPLLDYSDLNERIEMFRQVFLAHSEQTIRELERRAGEHSGRVRDESRKVESTKEAIERQKEEQKKLHQIVASEKQADSAAQTQLSTLQTSLASLEQRLTDAERDRDRLQTNLEKKIKERESRKARLMTEVKRNRPELLRFNEKLGCRVSAGSDKTGGKGKSTIKFTFNLINPADWAYEAKFVIDASKSNYKILSHSPAIPQEKLDDLVSDLNSSRALFTFIKRMRVAFKEEIERQRLAQKAARKGE